ncbi:phenylacetaldehyde reductase-like [Hevea brasiliensis]|uniref:phenylacetaldehyde reductase-like n=1 Tax=Hevea brasiliensis TaxID=3981 RepID=UPI0025E6D189|nr:phenylacetaldehyde reductase-like [Hevea brasiliensis]
MTLGFRILRSVSQRRYEYMVLHISVAIFIYWLIYFCIGSLQLWHVISKIFAEEAGWRFAKENGIDLVTIHPGFVIGPLLQPTLSSSVEVFAHYINGAQIFPNDNCKFVDARDVANAHIGAFELASASGRLCLVGRVVHYSEFLKIIHKHYPTLHIPEKCQDDKPFVPKYEVSKEKAKALGIDFIPLDVRVVDTIESLKEKGFLNV